MSLSTKSLELQTLSREFSEWRRTKPHKHFPRELWKRAIKLLSQFEIKEVARATGYSSRYLLMKRDKLQKASSFVVTAPNFVEIPIQKISTTPLMPKNSEVKLSLRKKKEVIADVSYSGSVEQLFPLLFKLLGE